MFGAFMGPFLHRQFRRQREAVGPLELSVNGRRSERRGAARYPRTRTCERRSPAGRSPVTQLQRRLAFNVAASVLFIAMAAWLAVTRSSWWWLSVAAVRLHARLRGSGASTLQSAPSSCGAPRPSRATSHENGDESRHGSRSLSLRIR